MSNLPCCGRIYLAQSLYFCKMTLKACGSIGLSAILILLRDRADMDARVVRYRCTSEQSAMGSETLAVTDRVTKQIVTIHVFSKTCNNLF